MLFKDWKWPNKTEEEENTTSEVVPEDLDGKEHPSLFKFEGDDISSIHPKTEILRAIDLQKRMNKKRIVQNQESSRKSVIKHTCYIENDCVLFKFDEKSNPYSIKLSKLKTPLLILKSYIHISSTKKWATKELLDSFIQITSMYHGINISTTTK